MRLFRKKSEFFDLITGLYGELQNITMLLQESAENFTDFEKYAARAKEIEHAGDAKTHEIIDTLNKLFVTPFDREDIYLLVQELDDVIDLIESVLKNIYLYGITEKFLAFEKFVALIQKATAELGKMLEYLQELKYSPELIKTKIRIHDLEDQGDAVFDSAIQKLLQEETNAVKIITAKQILEELEEIMDKYQKLSNIIEGILVKSN